MACSSVTARRPVHSADGGPRKPAPNPCLGSSRLLSSSGYRTGACQALSPWSGDDQERTPGSGGEDLPERALPRARDIYTLYVPFALPRWDIHALYVPGRPRAPVARPGRGLGGGRRRWGRYDSTLLPGVGDGGSKGGSASSGGAPSALGGRGVAQGTLLGVRYRPTKPGGHALDFGVQR